MDVGPDLRQYIGRNQARAFYARKKILSPGEFDSIHWDRVEGALGNKPRMYQLWYGKQCSGYCGTGGMIGRWNKEADTQCPNCKQLGEMAEHVNRCPDPG